MRWKYLQFMLRIPTLGRYVTKATYVEYWYPYDVSNKKAMTWDEYREDLANGRSEKEFTLATRYTAVFNAHEKACGAVMEVKQKGRELER